MTDTNGALPVLCATLRQICGGKPDCRTGCRWKLLKFCKVVVTWIKLAVLWVSSDKHLG